MPKRTTEVPPSLAGADGLAAAAEVTLGALAPEGGWDSWVAAVLRDVLLGGVRAGTIDGDVAKRAAELIVDRAVLRSFRDATTFIHQLANLFPELESPLRGVRAEIIDWIEPAITMQASAALREGHLEVATRIVDEFLELTERFVGGHMAPAPLADAIARLAEGGRP